MNARVEKERRSFDEGRVYAASDALHRRFDHVFTCPNSLRAERHYRDEIAGRLPGADALEIGCFDGSRSLAYLALGARRYVGIDISGVLVEKARRRGMDAQVMDAHNLSFDDASFDLVFGRAILHHLDLERALREFHRVLRPGGTAVFMEPLRDNPAFKLVRALTPAARTDDETPLSRAQIERADRLFGGHAHAYAGLASTGVGAVTSFLPVGADNPWLHAADRLDRRLERTPLRYWMRQVTLVWRKEAP